MTRVPSSWIPVRYARWKVAMPAAAHLHSWRILPARDSHIRSAENTGTVTTTKYLGLALG